VDYPEENINRKLRVVSLTTKITRRGYLLLCTLSNRALTRESPETKRTDDIDTHNRGYGGFVDRDQTTSGWNAAGDGTPQTLEVVNWPDDVVQEKTVELTVLGRAWRSPIDPLAHSHSVTIPDHDHSVTVTHPSHDHGVDETNFEHTHDVTVTHPEHFHTIDETEFEHDHTIPNLQVASGENTENDGGSTTVTSTSTSSSATPYVSDQWETIESVTPSTQDTAGADLYFSIASYPAALDADTDQIGQMDIDIRASWYTFNYPNSSGIHIDHFHRGQDYDNDDTNEVWDYNTFSSVIRIPRNIDDTDSVDLEVYSANTNIEVASFAVLVEYDEHGHPIGGKTVTGDTSGIAQGGTTPTSSKTLGTTETATSAAASGGTVPTSETALGTTTSETTANGGGTTETTTDDVGASPEVITTFDGNSFYPTDVEIAVDGTVVTTIAGDGTQDWQETIDLSGQLTPGRNTITATPTGQRGEVNLILASELFRRGKTS
jgi:hypothetical protein